MIRERSFGKILKQDELHSNISRLSLCYMQRTTDKFEKLGAGIYRQDESIFVRDEEDSNLELKSSLIDDTTNFKQAVNQLKDSRESTRESSSSVQQLIGARHILETLDKQVSSYRELQNQSIRIDSDEIAQSIGGEQRDIPSSHVDIDQLLTLASNPSIPPETRRFALNYYVKHNIEGDNDECGCHFHHYDDQPGERSELLGELNECYRKLANERDKAYESVNSRRPSLKSQLKACESSEGISIKQSSHGDSDSKSVELVSYGSDENVCCGVTREDPNGGYYCCERNNHSLFIDDTLEQRPQPGNQRPASIESISVRKIKLFGREARREIGCQASACEFERKPLSYYGSNECNSFCCTCGEGGEASVCRFHSDPFRQDTSPKPTTSLGKYTFIAGVPENIEFLTTPGLARYKSEEDVLSEVGNALVSVSDSLEELSSAASTRQQPLHSFGLASPLNTNCYHYCYAEADQSERNPLLLPAKREKSLSLESILNFEEGTYYCLHCVREAGRGGLDLTSPSVSLSCSHSHHHKPDQLALCGEGSASDPIHNGLCGSVGSVEVEGFRGSQSRRVSEKTDLEGHEINAKREVPRKWTPKGGYFSEKDLVVRKMEVNDDAIREKQQQKSFKLNCRESESKSPSSSLSSLNKANRNLALSKRIRRRKNKAKSSKSKSKACNQIQQRDDQISQASGRPLASCGPHLVADRGDHPRELNYPTAGDEIDVERDVESNGESMLRAVKDIAKMSAPSLSALQYLPSSEIVGHALDGRTKPRPMDGCEESNKKPMQSIGNIEPAKSNVDSAKVIKRPKLQTGHDEECLLHRLCLCSCMAKSSQSAEVEQQKTAHPGGTQVGGDQENEPKPKKSRQRSETSHQSKASSSATSSQAASPSKQTHTSVSSTMSRASEPESAASSAQMSPSNEGGKFNGKRSQKRAKVGEKTKKKAPKDERQPSELLSSRSSPKRLRSYLEPARRYEEKQSPSFLNLLRSSSSHIARRAASPFEWSRQQRQVGTVSPSQLGSTGEPVLASAGSSPEANSELCSSSLLAGAHGSASSSPLTSDHQQRPSSSLASSLAGNELELSQEDETLARPTARDGPGQDCAAINKSATSASRSPYKKLLPTRRRLFSPSPPETDNTEPQGGPIGDAGQPHKSAHKTRQQKSFFSRSLHRLSNRLSPTKSQASEKQETRSSATSSPELHLKALAESSARVLISKTANKDNAESLTTSTNSLEGIVLPQQKPLACSNRACLLTAPDIVLSKVDYQPSCQSSQETLSSDMTRSGSYQNSLATSWRPAYRDEFATSDNGSERAYSLPATPFTYRNSSPISSRRARSPRLSHSPVAFNSPPSQSTQIEDGLKVCSVEHFEKHIGNIKGTQVEVQKRLFKNWINHFSPNLIQRDLVEELRDGIKLIGLIAHLTRDAQLLRLYEKLKLDKQSFINRLVVTPSSRLRHLSNVSIAIDHLRQKRGMKLINLNPMDIVSGKANVILGLCWNIILNFQLEQNFLKYMDGCGLDSPRNLSSIGGEAQSYCTSRLSSSDTNEDRAQCYDEEQRNKNWSSYEIAQKQLKDWLVTAETKLSSSLEPIQSALVGEVNRTSTIEQHSNHLKDLMDYFELIPVDLDPDDQFGCSSLTHQDKPGSLDSIPLNFLDLSGSIRSLVSTASSKISTLQSSRKATYNRLFDNFELKCRTLAAMLDQDQRDSLLLGVEELRSRLAYITEVRVPQVVSELKSIMERTGEQNFSGELADPMSDDAKEILGKLETIAKEMGESESEALKDDSGFISADQPEKATSKDEIPFESQADDLVDCSDAPFSFASALWHKIARAYRTSLPLNIALLICLVGICLVPLINKDACCELSARNIPTDEFGFHEKPT